jgi:hypothetical protein
MIAARRAVVPTPIPICVLVSTAGSFTHPGRRPRSIEDVIVSAASATKYEHAARPGRTGVFGTDGAGRVRRDDRRGVTYPRPMEGGESDVIESSPQPRRSRPTVTAGLVVAFAAVAVAGYLVGTRQGKAPTPSATADGADQADPPITVTGPRCSLQVGKQLQLGVEITNQSGTAATLRQIEALLPMEGLRATASTWGTCGQLSPKPGDAALPLPAGATTWLTMTFDVLDSCPGPLPVRFTVAYDRGNGPQTADLPAFNDLGDVPYTAASCASG